MKSIEVFGKSLPLLTLILAVVGTTFIVTATGIWIYSSTVTVHVTTPTPTPPPLPVYTLILNQPSNVDVGDHITFVGHLTATQGANVTGATINIYIVSSPIPTPSNVVATATTDSDGSFTCTYIPTTAGDRVFKAGYLTP